MRCISIASLVTAFGVSFANAHFQLQYPVPRGPFVQDSEPTFCDGYDNAVSNRTVFPIGSSIINLNSEHPEWTAGVIISLDQDPTSFADFDSSSGSYQMVVNYFQTSGEGQYCFPIDILASNVSGIQDDLNVTIQVIYDGGDGVLYQCADLTLSANATIPSNATTTCTNVTSSTTAASPTASSASAAEMMNKNNMGVVTSAVAAVLAGLASFL